MQSNQKIEGKALVVGANGGIGRAVSKLLAESGCSLALLGRNGETIAEVAQKCRDSRVEAHEVICDIKNVDNIPAAVNESIEKLGGLNYLVNCAGITDSGHLHESDLTGAEAVLDTNFRAHMYLARHALPEINKHSGGAVIRVSSVNVPWAGASTYTAANLGANGLAEVMFEDVREFGTRVCTIKPGFVNTPLVRTENVDKDLMTQPEDIARAVLFLIAMPETSCVTELTILPQRSPYI